MKIHEIITQGTDPWLPPCKISGLPQAEYFQIEAASSHFLVTLLDDSPLHAKSDLFTDSPAKDMGTLVHLLLLEPDREAGDILVKPQGLSKASNAGKMGLVEWMVEATGAGLPSVPTHDENGKKLPDSARLDLMLADLEPRLATVNKLVVTQGQYDTARRMRDNALAKTIGQVIFAAGEAESTFLAVEPVTNELCRIRPDWIPDGHDVLVDVKTTRRVTYNEFSKDAGAFNYHVQAAMYRRIESLVSGRPEKDFLFVLLENEPPYDVAFRQMGAKSLEAGRTKFERAMDRYRLCRMFDRWPGVGYSWNDEDYQIEEFDIPKWAM